MKQTYFKVMGQKTIPGHTLIVAVVPNDFIKDDMPEIFEAQGVIQPKTIYSGNIPNIKIDPDTVIDRTEDCRGKGIAGIITNDSWYCKTVEVPDHMGIGL